MVTLSQSYKQLQRKKKRDEACCPTLSPLLEPKKKVKRIFNKRHDSSRISTSKDPALNQRRGQSSSLFLLFQQRKSYIIFFYSFVSSINCIREVQQNKEWIFLANKEVRFGIRAMLLVRPAWPFCCFLPQSSVLCLLRGKSLIAGLPNNRLHAAGHPKEQEHVTPTSDDDNVDDEVDETR